ncbi:MAG: tig, partial [Rhodospirillales bacterium]|nr:tig [Rhodospirillales bacterium]
MEIAERPAEGLQRRFRLVLPPGPIAAECARRAAELAVGLDQNGAVPEAQRSAMLSRSEAAINADILGKAIEAAIGGILRDAGIRPAARPTITLEPRGLDGAYIVTINVEALPEVSVPVLGEVVLDRTVAAPDEDEIEAAVQALRRRHGVWHELVDAGADIADEITCDIRGWAEPDPLSAAPAPHPALRAERFAWRLGEEGVLPGLDAQLFGLRPGEVRRVSLAGPLRSATLPDELAGRALVLEARALGLRRLTLPVMDADFAKLCGHGDLTELRAALADDLRQEFAAVTARLLRQALLARLAASEVPAGLPRSLVENEFRLLAQSTP